MDAKHSPSQQPSARHTAEGDRFNRTLFAAVDAMKANDIEYALIGGVAASGLGRPRSTHDIDIFVRPEDAEAALEALERNGFRTEKTDLAWLYKGWKDDILVDVIFKSSGDIYFDEEMSRRAKIIIYHGREMRTVSPEDLIIIKSAVHNEVGPHHWHDALAILTHSQVDWEYLLRRARRAPRRVLALLVYAQSNDIWVPNRVIFELFQNVFGDMNKLPELPPQMLQNPERTHDVSSHTPLMGRVTSPHAGAALHHPVRHSPNADKTYMIGKIREALAHDDRTGDQDLKIVIGDRHILVRGETTTDAQKRAIEEVIQNAAPGWRVENQLKVPNLPGPEGAEVVV